MLFRVKGGKIHTKIVGLAMRKIVINVEHTNPPTATELFPLATSVKNRLVETQVYLSQIRHVHSGLAFDVEITARILIVRLIGSLVLLPIFILPQQPDLIT
jgi:hypothetical protein